MNVGREKPERDIKTVFRAGIALLRANIKFIFIKVFHSSSFHYHKKIRVYPRVELSIRNNGQCLLGENLKIESDTQIVVFGGKLKIKNHVGIGKYNIIGCRDSIEIGEGTTLGPNVFIYDHDHLFVYGEGVKQTEYKTSPVKIGNNVWIGANNVILRGTVIGDNSVIGAGGVLKGTYPANSIVIQKKETQITEIKPISIEQTDGIK